MTSQVPAKREAVTKIDVIKSDLSKRADEFKMVLPAHITVEKFQRVIATAAIQNPKLLECDRQSLLLSAMKLAQDGLLPDGREAALVPFSSRRKQANGSWETFWQVQPMPMVYGLRKKILQSGEVLSLQVGVAYAAEIVGGNFVYEIGIDPPIRHQPKLDMTEEEMADNNMVVAYSIARIKNPDGEPFWSVEIMRRFEVLKIRQLSQTGALGRTDRQGNIIPPKGPWVDWEPEMWKKSVLRRHSKVLPMSGDLIEEILRPDEERVVAIGAAHMLSAEETRPVSLPSDAELDGEVLHDPETGEIIEGDAGKGEAAEQFTGQTAAATQTTEKTSDPAPEQQTDRAASRSEPSDRDKAAEWASSIKDAMATANSEADVTDLLNGYGARLSELQELYPDLHKDLMDARPVFVEPKKDPATGMTEVSEEEARALDNPATEDDWADEGEAESPASAATDEAPAWKPYVDAAYDKIAAAQGKQSWSAAESEFLKISGNLPDEVADEIEKALAAKRKELQQRN